MHEGIQWRKHGPIITSTVQPTFYSFRFAAIGIVELYVYVPKMEM